jgi:RHS repeat-associated protein
LLWQPDCGKTWKRPQSNKLIAETNNDKHWQSYLYEPDSYRPLALVHGNAQQDNIKLHWYQNDHLGTPIALTGSLGDTLYECQYNAYGQIINETYHQDDTQTLPDNPLRFQGQYYDEETGLHYNLNRYYDPFTGRYITQDPVGILGGLNSYQYVNGDPINWIDPLGLIKVENNGFEGIAGKESNQVNPGANFAPDANPNLTVNMNQQNKHIVGTNEHKTANASAPTPRSTIDSNIDVQQLVDNYAGTGRVIPTGRLIGNPGSKEVVSTNRIIGQYYDVTTKSFVPTKNFTIHYAKNGVHIVPARP